MKKTLAIILSAIMLISALPILSFASETLTDIVELEYVDACVVKDDKNSNNFRYGTATEGPDKFFDADPQTKCCIVMYDWLPFSYICDYYYVTAKTKNDEPVSISSYQLITGNDAIERDPVEWRLYGSNDNTNWTLIDSKKDVNITEERNSIVSFKLENPTAAYKYFRFEFDDIRKNGVPEFQLSEIVLIETCVDIGHDIVIDEAVAATCTATGLTEGQHCSRCDDMTIVQAIAPIVDHVDADGDTYCDVGGEQLFCEDCGRPVHEGLVYKIICALHMLVELVKSFAIDVC